MELRMRQKEVTTETGATPSQEQSCWRSFFTNSEWLAFGILITLGILLRWTLLDARPYHHDESLHGMYGRYFYDFPESNYYKYDPMLHGPMLYNSMRFIYAWFGDSLWAARTPTCIMGTLFMFVPFLFRRYFTKSSVLILTAAVTLSPTLVYWARFLREDSWVISGMLITLVGFTIASNPWRAFFVLFGITVQWCTKESAIVSIAVLLGYLVFEAFFKIFILKEWNTLGERIFNYMKSYPWQTAWSVVVCALIYAWFYGAGFRYPKGIIDGLGYTAYDYWSRHHAMERIQGPFNFHIYVLGWYELPVFVAFLTHLVLFYRRTTSELRYVALFVLALIVLSCVATDPVTIRENSLWSRFKLKDNLDIVGLLVLLCHAPLVTIHHLLKREDGLAATAYFGSATFFVYSYLGEKVPWLSVYPLIFMLPYLTLFYQDYFKKYPVDYKHYPLKRALLYAGSLMAVLAIFFILERKPNDPVTNEDVVILYTGVLLIVIALLDAYGRYLGRFNVGRWIVVGTILFTLRASIQTNFLYAGRETEYLSQVHTTYDLQEVALQIIDDAQNERHGYKPLVFATGEATWPLAWYFRHLKEQYKFTAKPEERSNFTYLFIDWKDKREPGEIPEGYTARKINLRGWWVPEFKQMTLKKFLRYSINHYPWSPSGFTYTTLLMAKDRARFKE
jgi:uncharacterized protein (TIGR03663 family)